MAQERNQKPGADSQRVRDFMTTNPESVSERDSIRDVARIMKEEDTGVVPVVDGKKVIGLITDRDIVVRGLAEGRDIEKLRVNEVMTKNVRSIREDTPVNEALDLMANAEIRRLPVVNDSQELVGIVSIGDISANANQTDKVGKTLEEISEAPPNN